MVVDFPVPGGPSGTGPVHVSRSDAHSRIELKNTVPADVLQSDGHRELDCKTWDQFILRDLMVIHAGPVDISRSDARIGLKHGTSFLS